MSQLRRENFADHNQSYEQSAHEGHHSRKNMPGFIFAAFGGILGEYGNECGAQGGSSHQIVQEIGQSKSGVVGVGHGIGANLVRHGPLPEKSEQPTGQDAAHYDACGCENAAMNAGITHASYGRGFAEDRLARSSGHESKLYWMNPPYPLLYPLL